jgi:hypothetical protein
MKSFAIGLLMVTATLSTAFAQTDTNAPTGPNNPNPPAQLTGSQVPPPCGPAANVGTGATSPAASAGQPQGAQGVRQTGPAKDKSSAAAGCAGPDHPAGESAPAPANAPHP